MNKQGAAAAQQRINRVPQQSSNSCSIYAVDVTGAVCLALAPQADTHSLRL